MIQVHQSQQQAWTTDGNKSDEADVNPAVPGSSRHTRIIEDEENKPSAITKSSERSCQEDYSGKNNLDHDAETTTGIKAKHSRREVSSSATMNTIIKHGILKMDQPESNHLEMSDYTSKMKQPTGISTAMIKQDIKYDDPCLEHELTPNSYPQEKPDSENPSATGATRNGKSRGNTETEGKIKPRLTNVNRDKDDDVETVVSGLYDTHVNKEPEEITKNGESDKHGDIHRSSGVTYEKSCTKKSKQEPYKQYALNYDDMYGENTKGDAKEGNDNEVIRLARKDDSIR